MFDSLQSLQRTAAHQVSLSITISRSLLKLMSIESVMPSNRLVLCYPPLLSKKKFSEGRDCVLFCSLVCFGQL